MCVNNSRFIVFQDDETDDDYTGGVPPQIFKLKNLKQLDLSYQVSKYVKRLFYYLFTLHAI